MMRSLSSEFLMFCYERHKSVDILVVVTVLSMNKIRERDELRAPNR